MASRPSATTALPSRPAGMHPPGSQSHSGTSHGNTLPASASTGGAGAGERSFFEQQREDLLSEIATNMENVLQNINRLNRNLEGVIAVGNEFGAVEALWSQFEGVMGRADAGEGEGEGDEEDVEGEGEGEGQEEGDRIAK